MHVDILKPAMINVKRDGWESRHSRNHQASNCNKSDSDIIRFVPPSNRERNPSKLFPYWDWNQLISNIEFASLQHITLHYIDKSTV